jgi:hypothetical protein
VCKVARPQVIGEPVMEWTDRGLVQVCRLRVNVNLKVRAAPPPAEAPPRLPARPATRRPAAGAAGAHDGPA